MAKWPKVPALSGWLRLSRRGAWLLRGEEVRHPGSRAFIAANYERDEVGRYFFQNGPQRVYVSLERTPWILRLDAQGGIATHTGRAIQAPTAAYCDEHDDLYLLCELGIGLVHDDDLRLLAFDTCDDDVWLAYGPWRWQLALLARAELSSRFEYITEPR